MEPLSLFLAFTVASAAIQAGVTAALDFDDRPKPKPRVRVCWACCGTCRYGNDLCRECGGLGVNL